MLFLQYSDGVLPIVNALSMFVAQYNDIQQPSGAWKTVKSAISSSIMARLMTRFSKVKIEKIWFHIKVIIYTTCSSRVEHSLFKIMR